MEQYPYQGNGAASISIAVGLHNPKRNKSATSITVEAIRFRHEVDNDTLEQKNEGFGATDREWTG